MMELARADAIDAMMAGEHEQSMKAHLARLLDELMIPLHIAFDLESGGADGCEAEKLVQLLLYKGDEWEVMPDVTQLLCEHVMAMGASVTWVALVELIEKLAYGTPTGGDAPPAEGGAPA